MNILQTLQKLRDDIKIWVTNNINALNAKIDEKTVPIDNKLDLSSANPVQNKVVAEAIDNIPRFSEDYNDLTNAPNITEDNSDNLIVTDDDGNIIFKVDADGIHTTALSLNGEFATTEEYADGLITQHNINENAHSDIREQVNNISDLVGSTSVSEQINNATENYYTINEMDTTIAELSKTIVSESNEWKIIDEAENIVFEVNAAGAHTTHLTLDGDITISGAAKINNQDIATQKWVQEQSYATQANVKDEIAAFVEADPKALQALDELSKALENHEDAYDALLKTVGDKATKKELEDMKKELGENIVSDQKEFYIVDNKDNIVATIDANGIETTTITATSAIINDQDISTYIASLENQMIKNSEKDSAGGVATLDASGKIPTKQLPLASKDTLGCIKVYLLEDGETLVISTLE